MTNTVQIPNDQMIFSVQELKDKGFSYYKINQMVDKGILIKLNKKYYENVNFDGEESDFYYAYAFVPHSLLFFPPVNSCYLLSGHERVSKGLLRRSSPDSIPDRSLLKFHPYIQLKTPRIYLSR